MGRAFMPKPFGYLYPCTKCGELYKKKEDAVECCMDVRD